LKGPRASREELDTARQNGQVPQSRRKSPARQHIREYKHMSAYLIAEVTVTDDAWIPDYAATVHDIAARHGGKYLSRSGNIDTLEGEASDTTLIALIEFPSKEKLLAFVNDPDYAPFAKARQAGSKNLFRAIDDTDLAGAIPYLPKG
jgi:uncharacterized protein (DUF1330 family)